MPMASGLWLSLLCQVCQVCVCAGSGKRPHVGSGPSVGSGVSMVPLNGFPLYHFLFTLTHLSSMTPRKALMSKSALNTQPGHAFYHHAL